MGITLITHIFHRPYDFNSINNIGLKVQILQFKLDSGGKLCLGILLKNENSITLFYPLN